MSSLKVKNYLAAVSTLCVLLSGSSVVRPQQNPTPTLQGKSFDVVLIPNNTVNAGEIFFRRDTDHDGMTDEDEQRNGTDPNNPADADGDRDGDGVTNGDEVGRGTNPNAVDSDGDGVSDAEEIRLGYNPLDPNDTPPANTTIVSIRIAPASIVCTLHSIFGSTPVQLTVLGTTNTGNTVNLTNDPQTTYESLSQTVAVVNNFGQVTGASPGSTTIRVRHASLIADAVVNTTSFAPLPAGSIGIPGYPNGIRVSGNYAYIASGEAGLQVIDLADRLNPQVVAALDTEGNANSLVIVGNLVYLADGSAGLKVISISTPTNPVLIGSIDTPGSANDVDVSGSFAYIADLTSGLQIVDVGDPTAMQIIGLTDTPGKARGVAVSGNRAVVAQGVGNDNSESFANGLNNLDETYNGVSIIDVTSPAGPLLMGSVTLPQDAMDAVISNNVAYIAGLNNGLMAIDFSNPATPLIVATYPSNIPGFRPRDVALSGNYLIAADVLLLNFLPIFDIGQVSFNYRGGIDFSSISSGRGTAVTSDDQFFYLTTDPFSLSAQRGTTGFDSKLFIGRFRPPTGDEGGVAPTVVLETPAAGDSVREGTNLSMSAQASDDIGVAGVQFRVNGSIVGNDSTAPYEFSYQVPLDSTTLSVTATAFDWGGNITSTAPIAVTVTPDTPPSVTLLAPAEGTVLNEGELVNIQAEAFDDDRVTRVRFIVNGVDIGSRFFEPYEAPFRVFSSSDFLTVQAEATDSVGRRRSAIRTFSVNQQAPKTTVIGRVVNSSGQPVAGVNVSVFDVYSAQTEADGVFTLNNVTTINGDIIAKASATISGRPGLNYSVPAPPLAGATTDVGDLQISVAPTRPVLAAPGFFGERDESGFFGQDLLVSYPDRASVIFSFDGNNFVSRGSDPTRIGSVTSAAATTDLQGTYFGTNEYFVQLKGQSGKINKFLTEGNTIVRSTIDTGASGEAQAIAVDYPQDEVEKALLIEAGPPLGTVIRILRGGASTDIPVPANRSIDQVSFVDADGDSYKDVMATGSNASGEGRLLIYRATPQGEFSPPVESHIVQRASTASERAVNVVVGYFSPVAYRLQVAVLGDDRVRIYSNDVGMNFTLTGEVPLPGGQIPTGIRAHALNGSYSDLLVTTRSSSLFESRNLFTLVNNSGTGFDLSEGRFYRVTRSDGSTRIVVGEWGGDSRRLDVVVADGEDVKIFLDVSAVRSGS